MGVGRICMRWERENFVEGIMKRVVECRWPCWGVLGRSTDIEEIQGVILWNWVERMDDEYNDYRRKFDIYPRPNRNVDSLPYGFQNSWATRVDEIVSQSAWHPNIFGEMIVKLLRICRHLYKIEYDLLTCALIGRYTHAFMSCLSPSQKGEVWSGCMILQDADNIEQTKIGIY